MAEVGTEVFRILDAAANRAREGLRVVEDFVRFGRDDAEISKSLKEHRHELAAILAEIPLQSLISARDTVHDVGTTISTASEFQRNDPESVVKASFKRIQEALRSLEEYSKLIDSRLASRFERLRYQTYTTEKQYVMDRANGKERLNDQHVYLLVTASECHQGIEQVVKEALRGGVRLIQSREKSLPDREWLQLARAMRHWTSEVGALLIINDRPDIAVLSQADGVHVGQEELTVADARRIVGPQRLVGVSTHSLAQARQGVRDGADYLGVGPTFPSSTKSFTEFAGLSYVREVAAEIPLPWFAIGGIGINNVAEVAQAGAQRIAVSRAITRSQTPYEDCQSLASLIDANFRPAAGTSGLRPMSQTFEPAAIS